MNIEQIHYIVEVAKTKSLLAASNNLFVTQSALSQSISSLEKELGIKLFTRSRQGTIPTIEGKKIIKKALDIVIKLQEIKEEANECSEIQKGELHVNSIPVGMTSLVQTVSSFKKIYPQTKLRISQSSSSEIIQEIKEGKIDIGLIATKKSQFIDEKELIFEPFWEGKIVVGVGRESQLATKKSVNADELVNYPIIFYEEDFVQEFIVQLTERTGPLQTMFTSNNSAAILYALEEGLAITFGYDFSFVNSPFIINSGLLTLEIENFEQEPIVFGWVRSKNTEKRTLINRFLSRYLQQFQMESF